MLLAASPGGPTANLFSYLYQGDIALNITLTAINSVIAAFTLPFIVNLAIQHFINDVQQLGLQFSKVIQVFLIILVPVCLGMIIRHTLPRLADRLHKPVRTFAVVFWCLLFWQRLPESDIILWSTLLKSDWQLHFLFCKPVHWLLCTTLLRY